MFVGVVTLICLCLVYCWFCLCCWMLCLCLVIRFAGVVYCSGIELCGLRYFTVWWFGCVLIVLIL